jgi:hypothetical protein
MYTAVYGVCAPVDQANLGCGSCFPCVVPNAVPGCAGGACAVVQCVSGFADCNALASDGCEVAIKTDAANCGACGHACAAGEVCSDGTCTVGCMPPTTACSDHCANLVNAWSDCGYCRHACPAPTATTISACVNGTCQTTTVSCPAGQTTCPAPGGNVCSDTTTDPANCGACGVTCSVPYGVAACVDGHCVPCPPGLLACPGSSATICADPSVDNQNCGGCGVAACASGRSCWNGACVATSSLALVTGVTVDDLAVDATSIYFLSAVAGTVNVVPKTGGVPTALATGQARPVHLAVDSQYVYYSAYLGGAVMRVPIAGGTPSVVATAKNPTRVLVDNQSVYWINDDQNAGPTVRSAPKGGGPATVLYTESLGAPLYWLAQNTSSLVFHDFETVYQMPKAGGAPVPLMVNPNSTLIPPMLDVDDTYLYVSVRTAPGDITVVQGLGREGFLTAGALPSGQVTTLFGPGSDSQSQNDASPLAHDGTSLFFFFGYSLMKVGYCLNISPTMLLDGVLTTRGTGILAIDQGYVYWSDGTMIGRVPK